MTYRHELVIQAIKILQDMDIHVEYMLSVKVIIDLISNIWSGHTIKDKVKFMGFLSNDDMSKYLSVADVFVCPVMSLNR